MATAAESPGEQHFKKTSREIKSACRPERRPLAGRERKLNRNEKTEHVERSCFGVSCYVTETVDAKNGKVKSIFEKKKKKKRRRREEKQTRANWLTPTSTPWKNLKTQQPSQHRCVHRGAKALRPGRRSHSHKPPFTFHLRPAELQFPGRSAVAFAPASTENGFDLSYKHCEPALVLRFGPAVAGRVNQKPLPRLR